MNRTEWLQRSETIAHQFVEASGIMAVTPNDIEMFQAAGEWQEVASEALIFALASETPMPATLIKAAIELWGSNGMDDLFNQALSRH